MAPHVQDEPNIRQDLICDRFSNCGSDSDSTPLSSHSIRMINRIRFSPTADFQPIENRDDYSPEEKNACFYSTEEKDLMYASFEKVVKRMEASKRPKKNSPYRGLENFCTANAAQFDQTIHACIDAVMDEQDRQWEGNDFDWELFRDASLEVSFQSASVAYKMAAFDEDEARKAYISMAKGSQQMQDDASISTDLTDTSQSTMVHDIKIKHNKTNKTKSKKKTSTNRPPKSRSSGSRKKTGNALESLKSKVYKLNNIGDRGNNIGDRGIEPRRMLRTQ